MSKLLRLKVKERWPAILALVMMALNPVIFGEGYYAFGLISIIYEYKCAG